MSRRLCDEVGATISRRVWWKETNLLLFFLFFFFFSWHTLLERCRVHHRSPDWLPSSMQTRGQYSVDSNPPQLHVAMYGWVFLSVASRPMEAMMLDSDLTLLWHYPDSWGFILAVEQYFSATSPFPYSSQLKAEASKLFPTRHITVSSRAAVSYCWRCHISSKQRTVYIRCLGLFVTLLWYLLRPFNYTPRPRQHYRSSGLYSRSSACLPLYQVSLKSLSSLLFSSLTYVWSRLCIRYSCKLLLDS